MREVRYPYRARAAGPDDLLYRYEKLDVEDTLRTAGVAPVTVLRLPMVHGPGDPQRRVAGSVSLLEASGGALSLHPSEAAWRCTRG